MKAFGWLGLCLVGPLLVGACGKSTGHGPVTRENLPARVAQIQCESMVSCCKAEGYRFDVGACKDLLTEQFREDFAGEFRSNVRYDAKAAGECLGDAAERVSCGHFDGDEVEACERIFVGTLEQGAPCSESDECRAPAGGRALCSEGTCKWLGPTRHGKLGEPCTFGCDDESSCTDFPAPSDEVANACYRSDGLRCSSPDPTSAVICLAVAQLGEPCLSNSGCVAGAACGIGGVCRAPVGNGEPCVTDDECLSDFCQDTCSARRPSANDCALN